MNDFRYAIRVLLRTPALTALAILSLTLGIGANVTIYTIANAFLDQAIAGAGDANRLVRIYRGEHSPLQYSDLERLRSGRTVFSEAAGERLSAVAVFVQGSIQRAQAALVTDGYFQMLRVQPELGRFFTAADSSSDVPVVVVSHAFWQSRLAGDSSIVGKVLRVNERPFTVVGVAPAEFSGSLFLLRADLWVPPTAAPFFLGSSFAKWGGSIYTTARLADGATLSLARSSVRTVAARIAADSAQDGRRAVFRVEPARGVVVELRGPAVLASSFLMTIVALVLLIACANVSNLLLARATVRRRELGIRLALGAGRARLVRQLLLESLLIACAGGVLGLLSATWVADLIASYLVARSPEPIAVNVAPDGHVLLFALGASVASALLFGLLPALRATDTDVLPVLREEATQTTARSRARSVLIGVQVALCTVLLACSTLFLHSLANARVIDPGFDTRGVMDVWVNVSSRNYSEDQRRAFFDELQRRAAALPGVREATLAAIVPLGGTNMQVGMWLEGQPSTGARAPFAPYFNIVTPRYFETLGIPLVGGRTLTSEDRSNAPGAVVINERMATHFWPNEPAIGKRVSVEGASGPWLTVVGVVHNTKYNALGEQPPDFMYMPYSQHPRSEMVLQVRPAGGARLTASSLRGVVHDLDSQLPPMTVATLAEDMRIVLLPSELGAGLLGAFGLLALLLASVGIYGVTSYAVAQRTREMGIRAALGATARDLVTLVARQSMRVVAIGAAVGLILALASARLLISQLYGVSATDPLTFVLMPAFLLGVALLATFVPARRATRVDPSVALRSD
ncbi:MAG: ABC transporter permease [Gemmatimonadaceae bacterium]